MRHELKMELKMNETFNERYTYAMNQLLMVFTRQIKYFRMTLPVIKRVIVMFPCSTSLIKWILPSAPTD